MTYLRTMLPSEALSLVEKYLQQVVQGSGADILSLGLLGALWASSSGMTAIIEALNVVYDAPESRPFWRVRLVAIAMTIGLAGLIIASTMLVLYGEHIGRWVADIVGLGWLFTAAWVVLQWPVVIALMLVAMAIIYYVSPNVEQDWRWVTPGSVAAVVLWLLVSLGFKVYVENFGITTRPTARSRASSSSCCGSIWVGSCCCSAVKSTRKSSVPRHVRPRNAESLGLFERPALSETL